MKIHCKHDELVDIKKLKIRLRSPVEIEMDGELILISRQDLPVFCNQTWYVDSSLRGKSKYLRSNVVVGGKKRTIFIHQMILNCPDNMEIDHINGNGLDNRRENLRIVTHLQNQNNQRKQRRAISKYLGVYPDKRSGGWYCQASFNKQRKTIGRFTNEIDAARAYDNFILKMGWEKNINGV